MPWKQTSVTAAVTLHNFSENFCLIFFFFPPHGRNSGRAAAENPVTLNDLTTDHRLTLRSLKLFQMEEFAYNY